MTDIIVYGGYRETYRLTVKATITTPTLALYHHCQVLTHCICRGYNLDTGNMLYEALNGDITARELDVLLDAGFEFVQNTF